jgi:CheY-like chemotaxis protein
MTTVGASGSTVLVVEDDDALRDLIVSALEDEGFHVVTATRGDLAIEALEEHQPPPDALCLVLLDMMLPGADGHAVLRALAGWGNYVPVVAMSADYQQLARARDVGVNATLPKPFDLDRLVAVVERNCSHA